MSLFRENLELISTAVVNINRQPPATRVALQQALIVVAQDCMDIARSLNQPYAEMECGVIHDSLLDELPEIDQKTILQVCEKLKHVSGGL